MEFISELTQQDAPVSAKQKEKAAAVATKLIEFDLATGICAGALNQYFDKLKKQEDETKKQQDESKKSGGAGNDNFLQRQITNLLSQNSQRFSIKFVKKNSQLSQFSKIHNHRL